MLFPTDPQLLPALPPHGLTIYLESRLLEVAFDFFPHVFLPCFLRVRQLSLVIDGF